MVKNDLSAAVVIEKARPADVEVLIEIGVATFYEAYSAKTTPEEMEHYLKRTFTAEKIAEELQSEHNTFFLARLDGEVVGYSKLRRNKFRAELAGQKAIELQRLYVRERVKGAKVGKLLLKQCVEAARAEGYEVMWLAVWKENPAAVSFYEKAGFGIFGTASFDMEGAEQSDWVMKTVIS